MRMNISDWRKSQGKSLAELAAAIGISGANPARSLQRYETGERVMPAVLQDSLVRVSAGAVTVSDLFDVRLAWERDNSASLIT